MIALARVPVHIADSIDRFSRSNSYSATVAANPARTFALVNLAVFILALAVFLWLRSRGTFDDIGTAPAEPVARTVPTLSDSLSAGAVRPASAAQLAFLNEVLTDTTHAVQEGFVIVSRRHDAAYYLAARVVHADTSRSDVGLWFMRGLRDAPQSVKAINAVGEQYSLARRVDTAQDSVAATDAEAQRLLRYLDEEAAERESVQ